MGFHIRCPQCWQCKRHYNDPVDHRLLGLVHCGRHRALSHTWDPDRLALVKAAMIPTQPRELRSQGRLAREATVLASAGLLELRYCTVLSFVVVVWQWPVPQQGWLLVQGLAFLAVNGFVLGLFCLRPFKRSDGPIARFM
jgi:hypothetical protein